MAYGPKAIALHLNEQERAELEGLVRRRSAGQGLVQRARIVLACAEPGATNTSVAQALGVSRPCVIPNPADQLGTTRLGHQWKPAWPLTRSRSAVRATH